MVIDGLFASFLVSLQNLSPSAHTLVTASFIGTENVRNRFSIGKNQIHQFVL